MKSVKNHRLISIFYLKQMLEFEWIVVLIHAWSMCIDTGTCSWYKRWGWWIYEKHVFGMALNDLIRAITFWEFGWVLCKYYVSRWKMVFTCLITRLHGSTHWPIKKVRRCLTVGLHVFNVLVWSTNSTTWVIGNQFSLNVKQQVSESWDIYQGL